MNLGFWGKLKRPIFVLAPMADVTDAAFRRVIARHGKPDVLWTEFVSVDGLCSSGREKLKIDLWYSEIERPIVAQFFGSNPEHFYEVAQLAQELGFDGIDINMGCPDRKVEKQGAGAALIKNPELAQKIIEETKRGAGNLPVSVKTRIGYNQPALENWLPYIFAAEPAVVTIHARTRKEMSLVPADWNRVREAVAIRDRLWQTSSEKPLIFGNGDIKNLTEARERVSFSGADGAMVGRGIFGNPWFFNQEFISREVSKEEKLRAMLEHTFLFQELFFGKKNFDIMKKHYKAYVNGFDGARELRAELMNSKTAEEVERIVLSQFPNLLAKN